MTPTLTLLVLALGQADAVDSPAMLPRVTLSEDGSSFVLAGTGEAFVPWGVNYDHDESGRLLDEYWDEHWETVAADFEEIAELGANCVRIHLQVATFLRGPDEVDSAACERLAKLVALAESTGLYLDVTGLGCYHKQAVPDWYDALPEAGRWAVQARFWRAIARTCKGSPAIFCYDLMNEPLLTGGSSPDDWLPGEPLGGKYFVQRITLDLGERSREEVARRWVELLTSAIREEDSETLLTVGVIPWAHVWPNAKPLFYAPEIAKYFDFVSVHFYPQRGELDKAIAALKVYDIGKPLVIEEIFPLKCGTPELLEFIERSRGIADGWISFYWGTRADEYVSEALVDALKANWLQAFAEHADEYRRP